MALSYAAGGGAKRGILDKLASDRRLADFEEIPCVTKAGVPTEAAAVPTFCHDTTSDDVYICTVAAGTWVKINA